MRTRAATPSASAPRVGASRRRSGSRRTRSRSSARPGSCTTSGRSACPKRCCASAASLMTRSGRSCESTRSLARRSSRRSSSSPPALSRSVTTTSASTAAAIPTASRAKPSRSAHASSRSPTCTMRSRRIGRIAPRCRATRRSSTWRGRRAGRSTAASWRSLSSWRERARRRIRMWTLDQPWRPRRRPLLADTPTRLLATLAGAVATALLLAGRILLPPGALGVVGVAAGQGALLATTLAWAGCGTRSGVVAIVLLGAAAAAATRGPAGALAYLIVPLWLAWLARRGRLATLGLAGPVPGRALLAAVALGAFLGGHLLVSASLTLGVRLRPGPGGVLAALAYDAGANVLAAECFFRGALFNRAQRRWSFATGVVLATAAYVVRYLVDPLLPESVEWVVGAAFYLTLLSAGNCWLFWWSGSLVPGGVAALLFFAAYRLLGTGA